MDLIHFVFSDLLHFIGALIILNTITTGTAGIIRAWRGTKACDCGKDDDE